MWAWATMTSMVENMSELLVGSYCVLIPCLTRPRITRSVTRSVPTRVASARPCVSNRKAPDQLGSFVRRLMVIAYPSQSDESTVRPVI